MRTAFTCLFAFLVLAAVPVFSQIPKDLVVKLAATVDPSGPTVTLTWDNPATSNSLLFRREKGSPDWFIVFQEDGGTSTSFEDTQVTAGTAYEYGIQRVINSITAYGYLSINIETPAVDDRGTISVFVEAALESPLSAELQRLHIDLVGDGWQVLWHYVPNSATVASIKSQIVADAAEGSTTVFLFGEIPVPYSGNIAWDGHPEHQGAWPADAYYGDLDSDQWTDIDVNTALNTVQPGRTETQNVPSDGKFDNSFVPTPSELAVGRVDFSNLSEATFGASRIELYRRYLNKNHNWRTKQYTVNDKVLVDDNFGYFGGEAFAGNGYRNGNALVGPSNVVDGDFFTDTQNQSFLFAYGCGPGSYTSAGGVGSSTDFATKTVNAVFTMLFGSYHGDWDYNSDPFMMSALASDGGVLTCNWGARPNWFIYQLGAGETIGHSYQETVNACDNTGYFGNGFECAAHVSLLGDPSVRAQIVAPVSNVLASQNCNDVQVTWSASPQVDVLGYHVYRSNSLDGSFERMTAAPIQTLSFTDASPEIGANFYQVKAVVLEETPSGLFYNTSTGVLTSLNFAPATPPTINLPNQVSLTCTNPIYHLDSCGPGVDCVISGPGVIIGSTPYDITQAGSYTVIATDISTGCTATKTLTVTVNNTIPLIPTASFSNFDCQAHTAQLSGNSNPTGITYFWVGPNGFTSIQQNPTVTAGGVYTLTVTSNANGCTSSASVTVPAFNNPDIAATGGTITCGTPSVQLLGSSNTSNVTYEWEGPNGFHSTEQNPTVTVAGDYTLTVSVASGCASSLTVTVDQAGDLPQASPTASGLVGCGGNSQVTLTANPDLTGYTFDWTGPNGFVSNEENPVVTMAGTYSVLVFNPTTGCASIASITVGQSNDGPQANPTPQGQLSCVVDEVTINANPEAQGLTFAWSGPNGFASNDENPLVTKPGVYTVLVTNPISSCSSSFSTTVVELTAPSISINFPVVELNCTTTSLLIDLSPICGLPGLSCHFNGQPVTGPVTLDPFGANLVEVFDNASGCLAGSGSIQVSVDNTPPDLNVTGDLDLPCADDVTNLTASSTAQNTVFEWIGVGTGAAQTIPAGIYTVIASSPNGCTASQLVEVTAPPALVITNIIGTFDCGGLFEPTVTVTGGVGPYNITYFPNPPFPPNTMFEIGVTDANGCQTGTTGNTGTAPSIITGTTTHTNETVLGDNDGSATIQVTGGVAPYSYSWSNGQTSQTINNLSPGQYGWTVTDQNGCQTSGTVTIQPGVNATNDLPGLRRLAVSPNPSSGGFELALALENPLAVQVELLDVTGRILSKTNTESVLEKTWQFDISASPSGIYFCKIVADGKVAVLKVVKD